MTLTEKQSAFVAEYLANGLNAARAAEAAGYSVRRAKQQGHELLKNPTVAATISKALEERRAGLTVDSAFIIDGLTRFAEGALEGRFPASAGVRALSELARLGGLYRPVIETTEETVTIRFDLGGEAA